MGRADTRRPPRKRSDRYHYGDLRPALLQAALRIIQKRGVDALTLRAVGEELGVSRTALYRHFPDKSALLVAVATDGFTTFRLALLDAWNAAGRGQGGFEAMGRAYIRFAVDNPSYYRVMFGGFLEAHGDHPALAAEGAAAFQVLVDSVMELQRAGTLRRDDPLQLARFIWANVHGVAMLTIDGLLRTEAAAVETFTEFVLARVRTGILAGAA